MSDLPDNGGWELEAAHRISQQKVVAFDLGAADRDDDADSEAAEVEEARAVLAAHVPQAIPANPTPRDYKLDHDAWRPGQLETIQWLEKLEPGKVAILQAPTGSGKTAYPKAVSVTKRVITLCRTKALQMDNYGRGYGFDVLYGKGNYDCVHPDNDSAATAEDCLMSDKGMIHCEYAADCPYLQAKHAAIASRAASLNYAYWLTSRWPRESLAQLLALDEAHELSEVALEFAGCSINTRQRSQYGLGMFPVLAGAGRSMLDGDGALDNMGRAMQWLSVNAGKLSAQASALLQRDPKAARRVDRLAKKLQATIEAVNSAPNDWYLKSGPDALGPGQPGLVIKPLTARHHFPRYFLNDTRATMMMSATIGDFATFAQELGITEYVTRDLPSAWEADVRPVLALDAPRMGHKTSPVEVEHQADVIARAILDCPGTWNGVIHVTRKTEARALGERLSKRLKHRQVWTPNEMDGTDGQLAGWQKFSARNPGALAITWAWWAGVNLVNEKICIVAKTPFPFLGDEYERARMNYSGSFYLQRTACMLEQGLGRTRRGRPGDYDLGGQRQGLVAIADANWKRAQKYLTPAMRESIRNG